MRKADELDNGVILHKWSSPDTSEDSEDEDGSMSDRWEGNGVEYAVASEVSAFTNVGGEVRGSSRYNTTSKPGSPSNIPALGIDDSLRIDIIEWVLEVSFPTIPPFGLSLISCLGSSYPFLAVRDRPPQVLSPPRPT